MTTLIRFYALLSQVPPFPNGSSPVPSTPPIVEQSSPQVSQVGGATSQAALDGAKAASSAAVANLKGFWELYTTPNGVYWLSILKAITPLMVVGFVCWAFVALYQWNTSGRGNFPWKTLTPVILVIFLLGNNGRLLSAIVQAAHFLPDKVEAVILDTAVKGITGREVLQQANAKAAYQQTYNDRMSQCQGGASIKDYQKCREDVKNASAKAAQQATPTGIPANINNPLDILALPVTLTYTGAKMGMIAAIIGALTSLAYVSHIFFGLVQVLWASLAPVFTALHLIPNAPNLKVFFSGFIGISLGVVFNSAFQVGTAMMLATAGDWDPLILPLMNGVLGPVFALFIAYQGITGVYSTIGTTAFAVSRVVSSRKK
jgi:hypothetical protein